MYTYLTGSASWLLLTMVTEVFGVKGKLGDLLLQPKLVKEQFDSEEKPLLRQSSRIASLKWSIKPQEA